MASLFKACNEIQGTGIFNYTIGNNDISIEAFDSVESFNLIKDLPSQENIVLIKSNNITINSGEILAPTNPKKSLVLFCDTLTNNGTISMTGKGPNVLPHEYVILQNDSIFSDVVIPAYANNRLKRKIISSFAGGVDGASGKKGANRQCGSGGQGAGIGYSSGEPANKYLGATGSGYAFGGGAGAGGKAGTSNTVFESNVDVDVTYPMRGAPGFAYTYYGGSGGVGNPAGIGLYNYSYCISGYAGYNGPIQDQSIGVGGRIIIFCNSFVNNGEIQANGVTAYSSNMWSSASGGSSGGGAIDVFYKDSCQKGSITTKGGDSGRICGNNPAGQPYVIGGKGGDGSVTVSQLNNRIEEYDKTISIPVITGEYYYNETSQTCTFDNLDLTKVSITNNIKTNAGVYNVSITPLTGYTWPDGTVAAKIIKWTINKIDPIVTTWPTASPLMINKTISNSILSGGVGTGTFAWTTGNLIMTYPNTGYEVTFRPTSTVNYNIIKKFIIINLISNRNNSNFYKDSLPQEYFDFSKLLL